VDEAFSLSGHLDEASRRKRKKYSSKINVQRSMELFLHTNSQRVI